MKSIGWSRFRLLLCKSAEGQRKSEGAILWNFVSKCIPKLEQITLEEAIEEYLEEHRLDTEFAKKEKRKRSSSSVHTVNPLELDNIEGKSEAKTTEIQILEGNVAEKDVHRFNVINRFWKNQPETSMNYDVYVNNTVLSFKELLQKKTGISADEMTLVLIVERKSENHENSSGELASKHSEGKRNSSLGLQQAVRLKSMAKRMANHVRQNLMEQSVCTVLQDDKVIGDYLMKRILGK